MSRLAGHSIVLGGLGGDSHSVGTTILRHALSAAGHRVLYLGIHNGLEQFFAAAPLSNLVMVSCLDGHARAYLREFAERKSARQPSGGPRWYLGGNLTVGDSIGWERRFLEMGFDRVFVDFVDVRTVLDLVARDLHDLAPVPAAEELWRALLPPAPRLSQPVEDHRLDEHELLAARAEVLEHWRTGAEATDLESSAVHLARQPSFAAAQAEATATQQPLVQPRSGVPLLAEQIRHFSAFAAAGAGALSFQVDSFTRNNNYLGAEEAIRQSRLEGAATLNGFPVVNHGVRGVRRVLREVGLPLQTRHSCRDPRLLCEISYAGGVTAFEGGPICYNLPYYRDYHPAASIEAWRYVDRLTALYHARYGVTLDREYFGTLTGTLIPPSLAIATGILEAVLAVQQGVKCVSLGWAEQGHRCQDIAAIEELGSLAREVLDNLGHRDVQINTVYHQYMAAFPPQPSLAEELITSSSTTAALACPTRMLIKTPAEALKIPTRTDNLHGLNLAFKGLAEARGAKRPAPARVAGERALIRREAQAIIDSVVLCGAGSVAAGIVKAFELGYLDVPFAPSLYNAGKVLTARDDEGAVRYADPGALQLDELSRQINAERISARRHAEGGRSATEDYLLVEKDVMTIARGQYARWPLHD